MMQRAFTLIELLIVIAIIALLAALLLPVIAGIKRMSTQAADASNCKQLMASCLAYRDEFGGRWPRPAFMTLGADNVPSITGYNATACSFYTLAYAMDMGPGIFSNPAAPQPEVVASPLKDPQGTANQGDVAIWAPWGTGYAFDWSCPPTAGNQRAVMSTRDPIVFGTEETNIVFTDGHVDSVPFTVDEAASASEAGIITPGFDDDDIWTGDGDGSSTDTWGRGNRKRCFVR